MTTPSKLPTDPRARRLFESARRVARLRAELARSAALLKVLDAATMKK